MKKTQKYLISFTLILLLLCSHVQTLAYADWTHGVYEEIEKSYIAKGVKHEHALRFTDKGWLNMNVLRVDLEEDTTTLDVLFPQNNLGKKAPLSALVSENKNIVGAVNGDFFNMTAPGTLGPIVKNGELISTPFYLPDKMAVFNVLEDKIPFIDYWITPELILTNKHNDVALTFNTVNKQSDYHDTAVLFTRAWGEKTPPLSKDIPNAIEMIVENNRVRDIVPANSGSTIPEDGYILWATGSFAKTISENFVLGDKVELEIKTTPDFEKLALAIGGGAVLVKDGQAQTSFTHEIKGNHPRTALGISKDRKEVIFVTIDGRTASYPGVTQQELAQLMVSLGAYEAINLDGGGSTEMILRPQGEQNKKIVNQLSSSWERRIMNGIGIVSTAPKTALEAIKIDTSDTNIFVNTSRKFTLKGYDKNYNPVTIDADKIRWSVDGIRGDFEGNVFKPTRAGTGIITASYEGKQASIKINVLDKPVQLILYPSSLVLNNGETKSLKVFGINAEGYQAAISFKDLQIDIPEALGYIDGSGIFHASETGGSGIIKVAFDDVENYLPAAIGFNQEIVHDFETSNGTFLSYPATVTGDYSLSNNAKFGAFSGKLSYDFTTTDATRAAYLVFDNNGILFEQRPEKLGLWVLGNEGGGHWLRAKLVDAKGTVHTIDLSNNVNWTGWKYIEANIPSSIQAPVRLERIYMVQTNAFMKNKGSVYLDNLTVSYPVSLPTSIPQGTPFEDTRNIQADLKSNDAFRFFAHGWMTNTDIFSSEIIENLTTAANENAKLNVLTAPIDAIQKEQLIHPVLQPSQGYSSTLYKDSLFIQLDNTHGGLRKSNFAQWPWFLETLEDTNANSVFVILPKPLYFADPLEEKLFKDTLSKLKIEKNIDVWVLTGGHDAFKVTPEKGVRYVNLKQYTRNNSLEDSTQLHYLLFTVNTDKVTYEIKSIHE